MSDRIVTGVFQSHEDADRAIKTLLGARFKKQDISVVGTDSDEFRTITARLESRAPDRYATICGVLGAFIGGLTWLFAMYAVPGAGTASVAGPVLALISGAVMGTLLGLIAGAVIHFDTPEYAGRVIEGELDTGKVLVAVHTRERDERYRAENIMEEANAIEVASASTAMILGGLKQLQPLVKAH